ncbi:MAG TPA: hypothetical protein VG271_00520 [Beijerinckiaceae bacterium]|nr:hypothetical protein [Beijerinckiaceae bacterium]
MRINLRLAAMVTTLLCAGCASESHDELTAEAYHLVPLGTPAKQAQAAFASAGFACVKSYIPGKGDIMCDRGQYGFLAACTQHVLLSLDEQKSNVATVDVTGPYCAGM